MGETHANVGTKETSDDNMYGLMSPLKIDADNDYLFEGFAMLPTDPLRTTWKLP